MGTSHGYSIEIYRRNIRFSKPVKDNYVHDDDFYSYFAKKNKIEILTTCPNAIQLAKGPHFLITNLQRQEHFQRTLNI